MENKTITINFADESKLPSSNLVLEPLQINTTTPIFFIGENTRYYGQFVMQSLLSLLERFASPTEPSNPTEGMLWFDSIDNVLKVAYTHTPYIPATDETPEELPILKWREVGIPYVSETIHRLPPGNLLWYNTDDQIVYIRDINTTTPTWIPIGENFLPLTGSSTSKEHIRGDVTLQDLLTVNEKTTVSGLFSSSNVRVTNNVNVLSDVIIGSSDELTLFQFDYTGSLSYGMTTLSLTDSVLWLSEDYFKLTAKTLKFNTFGTKESYFEAENDATESYFTIKATSYIDFNNDPIENCKYSSFDFSASPPVYINDDIAITKGILDDFIAVHNTIGSNTELLITGDTMDSSTTLNVDGDIFITNNVSQPANITFQNGGTGININTYMFFRPGIRFTPLESGVYNNDLLEGMLYIQSSGSDTYWYCKTDTIAKNIPDPVGSPLNTKQLCNRKYAEDKVAQLASIANKNAKGKIKGSVSFRMGKTGDSIVVDDAGSYNVTVRYLPHGERDETTTHSPVRPAVNDRPEDWIYGKVKDVALNPEAKIKANITNAMKGNIEPSRVYAVYEITFNNGIPANWTRTNYPIPPIGAIISSSVVDTSDDTYNLSTNDNIVSLFNYETKPFWKTDEIPGVYIFVSINYNFMLSLNDGQNEVSRVLQQFRSRLPFNYYSVDDDQYFFNEGPKQIFKFKKDPRRQEMWRWDDGSNHHYNGNEFVPGFDYYKIFPGRGNGEYGTIELHVQMNGEAEYVFELNMNEACKRLNGGSGWNNGITYVELVHMLNDATQNMIQVLGIDNKVEEYKGYFKWRFSVDYPDFQAIECIYIGPDPELTDVKVFDKSGAGFFSPFTSTPSTGIYEGSVYGDSWLPKPPAKYLDAIFFW